MGVALAVAWVVIGVLAAFAGAELAARALNAFGRGALAPLGALAAALAASAPEFVFAARAASDAAPGLVLGLVVGSLVANALLAAVLAAGGAEQPPSRSTRILALWTALAALALTAAAFDGVITRIEGGVMALGALLAAGMAAARPREPGAEVRQSAGASLIGLIAGAALLAGGGVIAVDSALSLTGPGVASALAVGVIVFGLAAALPEITAAIVAGRARRGATGLANVVAGAAITTFGAAGLAASITPLQVDPRFMGLPAAALMAAAVLLALLTLAGGRLPRWAPAATVPAYVAFLGLSIGWLW